jgi:hypothetical protein
VHYDVAGLGQFEQADMSTLDEGRAALPMRPGLRTHLLLKYKFGTRLTLSSMLKKFDTYLPTFHTFTASDQFLTLYNFFAAPPSTTFGKL